MNGSPVELTRVVCSAFFYKRTHLNTRSPCLNQFINTHTRRMWVKAIRFLHMLQANKKSKLTINTQRERERERERE